MKITESATEAILDVMKKNDLDPKNTFLEIGIFKGDLGMSFTRDKFGKPMKYGELTIYLQNNLDSEGIMVDFGEINGRKGLIFLGEENGNKNN